MRIAEAGERLALLVLLKPGLEQHGIGGDPRQRALMRHALGLAVEHQRGRTALTQCQALADRRAGPERQAEFTAQAADALVPGRDPRAAIFEKLTVRGIAERPCIGPPANTRARLDHEDALRV